MQLVAAARAIADSHPNPSAAARPSDSLHAPQEHPWRSVPLTLVSRSTLGGKSCPLWGLGDRTPYAPPPEGGPTSGGVPAGIIKSFFRAVFCVIPSSIGTAPTLEHSQPPVIGSENAGTKTKLTATVQGHCFQLLATTVWGVVVSNSCFNNSSQHGGGAVAHESSNPKAVTHVSHSVEPQ